jgi:DNA-binding transcriptional MerR regulator
MMTAHQLAEATGASYRQVDYWTRRGLLVCEWIEPGGVNPRGLRLYDDEARRRLAALLAISRAYRAARTP